MPEKYAVAPPILDGEIDPVGVGAGQNPASIGDKILKTILLVDDNVDLAVSTAALLELWGYRVHVAHTGRDAILAVHNAKPQVILMDIGLPEMDGFQVLQRLRESDLVGRVHTIAVTGYGQDQDKQRIKAAGFDTHLIKPVDPQALKQLLDELWP